MKEILFRTLVMLLILPLAACQGQATPLRRAEPPVTAKPTAPADAIFGREALDRLSPGDLLIQQDFEPGLFRPETYFEFGRVPPFSLFADGTLIYLQEGVSYDEETVMQVKLSPEASLDLVRQVLAFGFEGLQSNLDECQDQPDGTRTCVMDASTVILRARLPSGELREVKIYHDYANDLNAFQKITRLLTGYKHPAAEPYKPEGATLFIRPSDAAAGVTMSEWPLDAGWLSGLDFGERGMVAVPLMGGNLSRYLAAVPRNTGDAFFSLNGEDFAAYLVPWLPGQDYRTAIRAEYPLPEIPASPTDYGSRFMECALGEPPPAGRLRLAYISDGDLWVWDEGVEPISLTGSGDVRQLRLSPGGEMVVFTRQSGEGPSELWAGNPAKSDTRRLTGGSELNGMIQILDFSFDESLVAFVHQTDAISGELWVAHTDGSGARRLVTTADLLAIVAEAGADSAVPAGITWIPNTYTLTFDARPTFEQEGIYIYVQRQVWAVDTIGGVQGVMLPAGEGGAISYSPDGTTMMITTPEELRLMNVEARDLHSAGLDFFAVGFGEYYAYPPMTWTADSQAFLIAQPKAEGYEQDLPVAIWLVPIDGSPASKLLEVRGFFPSFSFSPELGKVAYWRSVVPGSNQRELHIAELDNSEHVVYQSGESLDFMGWLADHRHFAYGFWDQQRGFVGDLCGEPVPLQVDFYPVAVRSIDFSRFLFERPIEGAFELYEGHPDGTAVLRLNIEAFGGLDYRVLAPQEGSETD